VALGLVLSGCGDGGSREAGQLAELAAADLGGDLPGLTPAPTPEPEPEPEPGHPAVTLRDRLGAALTAGATAPYSPRQTCGGCHDIDTIASGYHFQQGRLDAAGNLQVQPDYFGDGRTFVRSDGMYGKW
jgi:hypothetical protein